MACCDRAGPGLADASRSLMMPAMILGMRSRPMSTSTLLELFGGFAAACFALWFVAVGMPSTRSFPLARQAALAPALKA